MCPALCQWLQAGEMQVITFTWTSIYHWGLSLHTYEKIETKMIYDNAQNCTPWILNTKGLQQITSAREDGYCLFWMYTPNLFGLWQCTHTHILGKYFGGKNKLLHCWHTLSLCEEHAQCIFSFNGSHNNSQLLLSTCYTPDTVLNVFSWTSSDNALSIPRR